MAAKRTQMDSAELLRQLRLAIANQPEAVPEGFKTSAQWADEWKITNNAAGIVLCKSVKNGLIESKKFRVMSGSRGVYPVVHYRLKQ
jgi:Fic family protein